MEGYVGIGPCRGQFIPKEEALGYALDQCGLALCRPDAPACSEFCRDFTDWFYSSAYYLEDRQEEEFDNERDDYFSPGMAVLPVPPVGR